MIGDITDFSKKTTGYYESKREEMLKYIPKEIKTSLEFGCGFGRFSALLKEEYDVECWGVEINKECVREAEKNLDRVINSYATKSLKDIPDIFFDCIIFNDILEHIINPYSLLVSVKKKLTKDGVIVASIPNVRYCRNWVNFALKGEWDYQDGGTLDKTHLRFFTYKSILKMFEYLRYDILLIEGINPTQNKTIRLLNTILFNALKDFIYFDYATVAKPKSDQILR